MTLFLKTIEIKVYGGGHAPSTPLQHSPLVQTTPPTYRMPPSVETAIPGSTVEYPTAIGGSAQLYTHSNKFPIKRQITLSSTEKNFKVPILHDLKKRPKGALITPDVPPKRITAWVHPDQMQPHEIYSDQPHLGQHQSIPQTSEAPIYRASYCSEFEQYGVHELTQDILKSTQNAREPYFENQNSPMVFQQVDAQTTEEKSNKANSKGVSKTYHAIKDIISGKFRNKEGPDKTENTDLNNLDKNLTKSPENLAHNPHQTEAHCGPVAGSTPADMQYGPHIPPKPNMVDQSQQYYTQQLRTQQQQYSQMVQARSQEVLRNKPDEQPNRPQYQMYGSKAYMCSPKPPGDQHHHQQTNKEGFRPPEYPIQTASSNDYHKSSVFDKRSAQQIEREKQRNLEARRTLSQPHLLLDGESNESFPGNLQETPNVRRGSLGNILEANMILPNHVLYDNREKDSDNGGFTNYSGPIRNYLGQPPQQPPPEKSTEPLQLETKKKTDTETGGRSSSNIDSGRGSAAYSSGRRLPMEDLLSANESIGRKSLRESREYEDTQDEGNDSEWVDIVEKELRHILEPKLLELSLQSNGHDLARSTVSDSISSITPPLLPLSGDDTFSSTVIPKHVNQRKHLGSPSGKGSRYDVYKGKLYAKEMLNSYTSEENMKNNKFIKKIDYNTALRGKQIFGLDTTTDLTSTTTRSLDLESVLDGPTDSDGNLSVSHTKAIRKQLEGLENMYSEVLKFLGVNKRNGRYQPSDPRIHKKRYGSMSSLPSSSVSSVRRDRRYVRGVADDRRRGREPRTTARRFQRLEAHVVTLARSVAHLSSEMRTQHLVVQEIEAVRQEVATLRAQTNMLNIRAQSISRPTIIELPTLANPTRVKKLTKFFGDEPPLVRLFLRKLGYEKYANTFENEKIGMVELPYLTEDRLQKMGIPLGPRLRIMQEAQISVYKDNTLCIV